MAPPIVTKLVEQFERNRASYQAAGYNETQVRREFLDPFFKALGWDVDNEQGHAEAYKDVIHEDAIKVGGEETEGNPAVVTRPATAALRVRDGFDERPRVQRTPRVASA